MRRSWCGVAPLLLICLGASGCAVAARRDEAPIQFRQWKPKPAAGAANSADPTTQSKATTKPDMATATAKPGAATESASASKPSIWNYRPGSLLFRKPKPAANPPAAAAPNGSLAQYFPALYGQGPGDPARVARARQPGGGDRPAMLGAARVETSGNTLAVDEPDARERDRAALLPAGIVVQAFPTPAAPPIVVAAETERPAGPDAIPRVAAARPEPKPTEADSDSEAKPAGSDEPVAVAAESAPHEPTARKPDLIDALTARLEADADADEVPVPSARPGDLVPARDTPRHEDDARPAAPVPPAALPAATGPVLPSPSARLERDPALAGRPRLVRAESMDLPPPEFPPTYHTESLRKMARERDPGPSSTLIAPEPRRPVFPRLAKLWQKSAADEDKSVKPTSARRDP